MQQQGLAFYQFYVNIQLLSRCRLVLRKCKLSRTPLLVFSPRAGGNEKKYATRYFEKLLALKMQNLRPVFCSVVLGLLIN